jgi:hypothetical protein
MAISFVASSAVVTGANPTVAIPAGYAKDDLLLLVTSGTATPTTPTGWTQLFAQGAGQFLTVLYKYATASEASVAVTLAGTTSVSTMVAWRGAGAFQVLPAILTGTSTAPSTNTLTTTYTNDTVLSIYANTSGAARTWTANASTTARQTANTTTTTNGLLIASETKATAGLTTARAATISVSSAWAGIQIAFIETRTVYWVGGNGTWAAPGAGTTGVNWADASAGAGSKIVPSQNDAVIVNGSSGSPTITLSGVPACASLTTTGATCTLSSTGTLQLNGGMTLSATTTWSATGIMSIIGTGTVTTNAVSLASPITIDGVSQTVTLGGALTTTGALTLTNGTLTLNGFDASCLTFSSDNSNTRAVAFGSNNVNITTTATTTALAMATLTGFTPSGTGAFKLTGAATSGITRTISAGNTAGGTLATAPNVWISAGAAGSTITITNFSRFGDLNFTGFSGTNTALGSDNSVFGSLTLASAMTWNTGTGVLTFGATSSKTITSAGKSLYGVTFNGTGGTWTLQDAMTATNAMTLTAGTLTLNGFDASCLTFSSDNSNTRAVSFGSNNINITTTATVTALALATLTGFTPSGTGAFKLTGAAASAITRTLSVGSTAGGSITTAPNVSVSAGAAGSIIAITTGSFLADLNFTGFSGTFAPAAAYTLYGSLTAVSGMTWTTGTGTITFAATSTGKTITSAGKSLYAVTFNGVGGAWTLQDAMTATNAVTLTNGALTLNGFDLSCDTFSSNNSNTRSIALGSNNVNITSVSTATVLTTATATNLTISGTGAFRLTGAASAVTRTINVGQTGGAISNSPNILVTAGSDTIAIGNGSWVQDLNFTGFSGTYAPTGTLTITGSLTAVSGMTWTTGVPTITFAATSTGKTITSAGKTLFAVVFNGVGGAWTLQDAMTTSTITLTAGALSLNGFDIACGNFFNSNNANTRSIAFGANYISVNGSGTTVVDITNATNLTLTGVGGFKLIYSGSVSTRAVVAGTTGGAITNAPNIFVTAGSDSIAITTNSQLGDLNFTGFTGTFITSGGTYTLYGSLTAVSGMTWTTGGSFTFAATSTGKTITTAGKSLQAFTFNGVGGSWTLQDALTLNNTLTLTNGTLNLNSFNVTCNLFSSNNANTRSLILGTSTITVSTSSTATVVDIATATNFTLSATTGIIKLTGANNTTTRTISIGSTAGAAQAIAPNIWINGGSTTSTVTITTGSVVNDLDLTGYSGTFTPPAALTIYGSLTVPGTTYPVWTTGTGTITFAATTTGKTISAGYTNKRLYNVVFDGVGGEWTLLTPFYVNVFTLTNGSFITSSTYSGYFYCSKFSSNNSNVRSFNSNVYGVNIHLTGTTTDTVIDIGNATNLTLVTPAYIGFNLDGATGSGVTRTVDIGSTGGSASLVTNLSVSVNSGTGTFAIVSNSWMNELYVYAGVTFTPPAILNLVTGLNFGGTETWTAGAGTINFVGTTGMYIDNSTASRTLNNVSLTNPANNGILIYNGNLTINTLSSSATGNSTITLPSDPDNNSNTTTIGTWAITGTNATTNLVTLTARNLGAQAWLRVTSGTVNPGVALIKNSYAYGGATFNATSGFDGGNNTGWTFGAALGDRYWVGGSGTWNTTSTTNWSTTSGGSGGASVPIGSQNVFFDANSGSGTITISGAVECLTLDARGSSFTFTDGFTATGTPRILGSFYMSNTTTWEVSGMVNFNANSTGKIINCGTGGNVNFVGGLTINAYSGSYSLGSNLKATSAYFSEFNMLSGIFNTQNYQLDLAGFYTGNGLISVYLGSSNIILYGLSYTRSWDVYGNPNLILDAGTSVISFAGSSSQEFNSAGDIVYYNKIDITGYTGTFNRITTLTGTGSFNTIYGRTTSGTTKLIVFSGTIEVNTFDVQGTATRKLEVTGSNGQLSSRSSAVQSNIDYLTITDLAFLPTPTATGTTPYVWYVGSNSTKNLATTGVVLSSDTSYKYYNLTSGTSWTVPSDWNSSQNDIYLLGGGGGGSGSVVVSLAGNHVSGSGGGGGGFTSVSNVALTPSSSVAYAIGAAGTSGTGSTTASTAGGGGTTSFNTGAYSATGGGGGSATTTTTTVGTAGTGSTYNGGQGGSGTAAGNVSNAGGGGGGSGGINGSGIDGGANSGTTAGTGGAGNNNVNNFIVGTIAYGDGGTGGTSGFAPAISVTNNGFGAGGGAAGTVSSNSSVANGTTGTQGAILLRYRSTATSGGNFFLLF